VSLNKRTRGKTQFSTPFFFADTTSSTGDGLSGVTSASPGLVMEYRRQGQSTWTSVTPQSGKTLGSYLSGGIVADGSPAGNYEVDFPDAAYASEAGVEWVALRVRGVTNMLATTLMIELDAADYSDPVRLGLTSLPNVAQGSSGALPTGNASGQVTVATLTAGAIQSFWDFLTSGLTTAGSIGKWILDNLNATVSSRASQTSADAIGAKTVNLPANPAAVSDIPTAAQIADAVLEESVDDHDGVAHSLAKYISIIKKANTIVEGTVTNAVTPTTTSFSSNVNYPTGAFKHAVLVFTNSAAINEQNSPILGYVNTNGVFTVEEPFTVAPTVGDEFIIKPTNHVHSIAAIQNGLATSTALAAVAIKFAGITSLANWLGAIAGKTADSTTRSQINATAAGASFNETTDSLEAIRDRGDAAWTSGGGAGGVTNLTVEDRSITLE